MSATEPACCPYLFYDDVEGAIAFLVRAFGLTQGFTSHDEDGKIGHAQLSLGDAVVMLGRTGTHEGYRPRKSVVALGGLSGGVYLFIDDADAHASRAREAGAKILMEPADMPFGHRLYCAEDPEGQFWMFAKRLA